MHPTTLDRMAALGLEPRRASRRLASQCRRSVHLLPLSSTPEVGSYHGPDIGPRYVSLHPRCCKVLDTLKCTTASVTN